jgi:hypothetical protein
LGEDVVGEDEDEDEDEQFGLSHFHKPSANLESQVKPTRVTFRICSLEVSQARSKVPKAVAYLDNRFFVSFSCYTHTHNLRVWTRIDTHIPFQQWCKQYTTHTHLER